MDFVLDLLKITIPALIVFLTVYYLMKSYISGQLSMQQLKYQQEQLNISVPLRLQAYERLILLCERVSLDDLMLRLRTKEMRSEALKNVLMLAVKQEFDHNLTQQLYVSDKLWQILQIAKKQLLDIIYLAAKEDASDNPDRYSTKLMELAEKNNPIHTAKAAVIKEGQLYF